MIKNKIRTKNFDPNYDTKLLCTCGRPQCDRRSVTQATLDRAQLVRDDAGRPLSVNSGGRCPYHHNELTRSTPADHQQGIGIDIRISGGVERGEIVALGLKHGFNAIGVAKTFVHLGYREDEKLVMWVY